MAPIYKTPGVFVEEIPKLPPSVAAVETAIPAFIGYTEKGEALKPTRIESLVDFETTFGKAEPEKNMKAKVVETTADPKTNREASITATLDFTEQVRSKHILHYALQLFYANGGKVAYVVSAGGFKAGGPEYGDLQACLAPLEKVDDPTLIVIPEATALGNDKFSTLMADALKQCKELGDRFVIMDAHHRAANTTTDLFGDAGAAAKTGAVNAAVGAFRDNSGGTDNLKFGAVYAPYLETILDFAIDETKVVVDYTKDQGPAASKPLADLQHENNGAYEAVRAKIRDYPLILPPSAAIAGVYARVDGDRGVWKAPANVSLNAVVKPTIEFSKSMLDELNVDPVAGKSINAIRPFVGKGTMVWGARTLAGNDNEWRYVSVRRFFLFAEESIKKATEPFTFEPNDANTWVKVQAMIENFLTVQWRAGALQGVKPEHAFYVAVGLGKTMTPLDILEGRMIIEIGMAVVRPAEFIILKFSHKMAES